LANKLLCFTRNQPINTKYETQEESDISKVAFTGADSLPRHQLNSDKVSRL